MATAFRSPFWPGVLSPLFSAVLGAGTYLTLTRLSSNPDADYLFRLGAVAFVMLLPPAFALHRAFRGYRDGGLRWTGWMAVSVAVLSLGLVTVPVGGAVRRARQAANLALSGVAAPDFLARDLDGEVHRLSDHRGSVVLVNIWATWCPPCRAEMPELDRLARERAEAGFLVYGISTEEEAIQQDFRRDVLSVDYPLLLPGALENGVMPDIFIETARYPANFLIDRDGLLHPAPSTDQPFEVLEAEVDRVLALPAGTP
ncbi:MAG: TlpA disulfide reductase family protein [Acidobacteria bacterium]|nr:TlpA disulfide reductase family protein [Acidobacteriota bacterium]